MANINKAIIVGYLGRDADKRFTASGEPVTTVSIATTDKWRDRSTGETRENTEWHRITFFGKLAEIAGQYLKKGSLVYVEGKLRTRKYSDRDGIERTVTEIIGDVMQMLGDKESRQGGGGSGQQQNTGYKPNNQNQAPYDDIPF